MTYKICYWDSESNSQKERDATPTEIMEIESRVEYVHVPQSVPMRNARLMLLQEGLLTTVQEHIANMEGVEGEAARINWEFALTVERNDPLVKYLIPTLGKTEDEIDQMFVEADRL